MDKEKRKRTDFLKMQTSRPILLLNAAAAFIYFVIIAVFFPRGNPVLFWLLILGEVFHMWQLFTYIYTVWGVRRKPAFDPAYKPEVDVFITVAGEPIEIIKETVSAAANMDYPNFKVFILNDGKILDKPNWKEVESLAKDLGVNCITRDKPGGAKAGNINNALAHKDVKSPFVVIFDADHVPHANFLQNTMGYFAKNNMGFVQTPQFYKNSEQNYVTEGAWEQQKLFFGPICRGKDRLNATFICGTNVVIRRKALDEVGGIYEESITEDIITSVYIHQKGWESVYVPEVLAEGLAPEDFKSYYKQQLRWARGSLELIFKHNPFFKKGLSIHQKIQYVASSSFYLSGTVVLLNAVLPLIYLFFGIAPLTISTMALAAIFLPYIFLTAYVLLISTNFTFSFRALAFSMASFPIHLKSMASILLNIKAKFEITSKKKISGNFLKLAASHIAYIALLLAGVAVAFFREGINAAVLTNISWGLFNMTVFMPFIFAASPENLTTRIKQAKKAPVD